MKIVNNQNKTIRYCVVITISVCISFLSGCCHSVKVIPDPTNSTISLDGHHVGRGVSSVKLCDEELDYQLNVCGPPGYFCKLVTINCETPSSIEVAPPKDHSYFETVQGADVVNKWVVLPIAKQYNVEEAWRKVMSSITTAISDFEVLDQKSLYVKSAWLVAGRREDILRTRSRIIVSVDNPDPSHLAFKMKIEAERINSRGEVTETIDRTFKEFLDALDTAKSRLGH